jgi:hypothetical protein
MERETVYSSLSVCHISGKNMDIERDIKKTCMG